MLMVMKKWILIGLGWLAIFITILAVLFIFTGIFKSNPIPENIRNKVDFATYYPSSLPEGYSINTASFETANNLLSYQITKGTNKTILVTQQKTPTNFNFTEFQTKSIKNSRSVTTSTGNQAYIGLLEKNSIASLRAESTWILLSTTSKNVSVEDLEKIIKSFTQ